MIQIKEAVTVAREHFNDFYDGMNLGEIVVESFELTEERSVWEITLACEWYAKSGTASMNPGTRLCKTLKIDAESGQVIGMRGDTL